MYLSYYGLERPPFDPTPQPDDLFETPTHNEALASLVYGILDNKGFIALSGEVGVGKTTVLRRALAYVVAADPKLLVVEVANPTLGPAALAGCIHRALKLDFDASVGTDLEPLRAELMARSSEGSRLLLVIDEAQSVPAATLEFLRILSNLAGRGRSQIQIVLSGQPELDAILQGAAQRALRQRIAVRARIRPLTRRQVGAYLQFKLSRAGADPGAVLSRAAIRRITAASAGFPRRVNIIADNALMAGFGADSKPVGGRLVSRALTALNDRRRRPVWMVAAPFAVPAALALAVFAWSAIPSPFGSGAETADRALASPSAAPARPALGPAGAPTVEAAAPILPAQAAVAPEPAIAPMQAVPEAEPPAPVAAVGAPPDVGPPQVIASQAIPQQITPGPAATAAPVVAQPHLVTYRVKPGDTLTMVLRDHAMPADAAMLARLRGINPELTNVDRVFVGQDIVLPVTTP